MIFFFPKKKYHHEKHQANIFLNYMTISGFYIDET